MFNVKKSRLFVPLLLMILLVAATTACRGSSDESSADQPSPTKDVVTFYDAVNSGDVERMADAWPDGDEDFFSVMADGLQQRVSVSCSPRDAENTVRCEELLIRNDFYNPAGIRGAITVDYTVEDDVIVDSELVSRSDEISAYEAAFGDWLTDNYPEVYDDHFQGQGYAPFESAEGALAVIALVNEFLEQSDTYPLAE